MTVKDIQAKQVTLDNAGKPITLKAGELQFLTTARGRETGKATQTSEGQSEKAGSNNQGNQATAKMEAEKRRQMEMKEQAAAWGMKPGELAEKIRNASPEERREIMQKMRQERAERGGRRGRARDR